MDRSKWVLVPMDPTREMVEAGVMFGNSPNKATIIYQSMVNAAPPPPAEQASGEHVAVLRMERDHARACYERAAAILAGIHAVIYPEIVKLDDGRKFAFNSPLIHEQMQALSDRIRAIPNEVAALSQRPVVDEAMVESGRRAMRRYSTAYPKAPLESVLHAGLTAALTPKQPTGEEG